MRLSSDCSGYLKDSSFTRISPRPIDTGRRERRVAQREGLTFITASIRESEVIPRWNRSATQPIAIIGQVIIKR